MVLGASLSRGFLWAGGGCASGFLVGADISRLRFAALEMTMSTGVAALEMTMNGGVTPVEVTVA